jgi:hypothetical protein
MHLLARLMQVRHLQHKKVRKSSVFRIWFRMDFALLDPDPYWEYESRSGSKKIYPN